jgi:hypothetical protein
MVFTTFWRGIALARYSDTLSISAFYANGNDQFLIITTPLVPLYSKKADFTIKGFTASDCYTFGAIPTIIGGYLEKSNGCKQKGPLKNEP